MELNERELMKIRDMLADVYDSSEYIIYKDTKKAKENRKRLKKLLDKIDNNDIEDTIYEISK